MLPVLEIRSFFACTTIYRSSLAVVFYGRSPTTILVAIPILWKAFQAHETILFTVPNSWKTLKLCPSSCLAIIIPHAKTSWWFLVVILKAWFHFHFQRISGNMPFILFKLSCTARAVSTRVAYHHVTRRHIPDICICICSVLAFHCTDSKMLLFIIVRLFSKNDFFA